MTAYSNEGKSKVKSSRFVFGTLQNSLNWLAHSPVRAFMFIFALAFGIRYHSLIEIPSRYLVPNPTWELNAIAISLLKTGQFANPYMVHTGPTAHLPPAYPVLFALIYHMFGLTSQAGYISMGFIAATNSIMYAMLPWLAGKLGVGKQAGLIGGIAGVFMLEWSLHGEGLTGIFLGLILVAFLRRWNGSRSSTIKSLLLGLGIGAAFHVQPALLPVVLGCLFFEIWWQRGQKKFAYTSLLALGIVLACIPWGLRNYIVFNEIFFIRSNLGLEIRMGNHEGAAAAMDIMDITQPGKHPRSHLREALKLRELGEVEYMRQAGEEALAWIQENPAEFIKLTFMRFIHFWFGPLHQPQTAVYITTLTILAVLGARHIFPTLSPPQRTVILVPLLTFPLIYYLVPYMIRYRVPIDGILLILAGVEVWRWVKPKALDNPQIITGVT
jgi:hypothetical protein